MLKDVIKTGRRVFCATGLALVATAGAAMADWPEKAVTLIVPWSAGGGTDATARAVASELEEAFGQPFNVVNRTGGGGLVGHSAIANAKADGYTLGIITIESTMYAAQGLSGVTPDDFTYIGRFNADPIGINIAADAPYGDAKGLIGAMEEDPMSIAASGANRGGLSHLAWVGLLDKLGIPADQVNWVASDGSAPALQQLASGAIDVVSTSPAEAQSLVDAGEAKTVALISSERSSLYPDLPTTSEIFGTDWSPLPFRAVAGPKGIPDEVVSKVEAALKDITEDPEFISLMSSRGFSVAYQDAATFEQTVKSSAEGLTAAMKSAGLTQ
ncbi:Bug family tripartite tricarboxylate transporter substrate binding protein [Pseudooceanicola spongiae]|uniref:Tripartite tricarboxylate transporter substrate binding protein n=1 Tax=Pseudooceanicola spongiae TaxID=2613965 RepID=A0A7L9WQX6_9RHOB|nr:tripartite tricarboxylate transporter substrate binding protein [Pseudooceanicola spongiae]QOL82333.1 tripartite tricarboxylate transporter substrate binding protein [Pseudooceanicola spongiae]